MTIFDQASLHAEIMQTLHDAAIPADHHVAVVAVATERGGGVVVAVRGGDHWRIEGDIEVPRHGSRSGFAAFKASW